MTAKVKQKRALETHRRLLIGFTDTDTVIMGQGYLWRGRGLFLQCTFKENYAMFANDMNLPEVMKDPDLVATDYPMESAIWFLSVISWDMCDVTPSSESVKALTKE